MTMPCSTSQLQRGYSSRSAVRHADCYPWYASRKHGYLRQWPRRILVPQPIRTEGIMNCSELIVQFLAANGVDRFFGVPGYANSPVLLSTLRYPEVKPVLTRHEANAAWMAYGYAQLSGKFGACTGTSGAGT